ncbi:MAG: radical SAM protein [Armatimonadota bacterium]|nr:radical SAM protein [Armatimonadota bacterium]MDR7428185.1 radical SAM protein [Armatimonadota bacterium]MDR7469615.1 radical SAM protein [Armatimonadota bacterium]MDR7475777.1 radical SAM protein [Armatimonadota bacterium]MDR7538335.1 radical SAM protein [Armatimonadota bacterium]
MPTVPAQFFLHSAQFRAAYLGLGIAELRRRAEEALELLRSCVVCPRDCRVNRLEDRYAVCKTGRHARVSSFFPHLGEEDCLRGWRGSGTIFFAWCNLKCAFCQNFDISHLGQGRVISPGDLARMMVFLQEQGCHNINFVTPEHVVPQILEALPQAVEQGLHLPIVYNTSAYDSLHSLRLLDGIVDIYMPDFKFWDREMSRLYLKAPDYPEVARRVITEMHRQVGPLKLDERGLARRGVLLRHLVMPGGVAGSGEIFRWIAREVSVHTYVNIMDQYYPAGRVGVDRRYDTINRRILPEEYAAAVQAAREAGLYRLDARLPRHPRLAWIPA